MLAVKLVDTHWENHQGLAYYIAGVWLKYQNIDKDDLLDQIGSEFGELELPDGHIAQNEQGVKKRWDILKKLVHEANKKFPQ